MVRMTLLALAAVLAATPCAAQTEAYFAPSLLKTKIDCGDDGNDYRSPVLSDLHLRWYSEQLRAAGEPSLYGASLKPMRGGDSILRFTWLRTFHAPVMVRIERSADRATLVATMLSGAGGYDPGKVARRVERPLAAGELAGLDAALKRTKILDEPPAQCDLGLDGSEWIVESAAPSGYRFVRRWSPDKGPVREFGLFLLGLTGWRFGERETY